MRISIVLEALTGKFETDMSRAMNRLDRDLRRTGRNLQGIGRQMSLGLTAPIVGFGTMALRAAGDFEQSMNRVQALSGATGEEFDALRSQAQQLGRETVFSASQAADAMGFLAMAGFEANETLEALPGTLELAASAQIELASAADIVSNVLSGYRLRVSDLARVNDVLVKTFTSTNTSLEQLGEAMKFAGPIASAAGVQFEEAAAAIGLMGNAGIQGGMAGTSLRGAMSRLLNQTPAITKAMEGIGLSATDAEGGLLPLADIIRQLEPFADDAGLMLELFGQRAGPAMAALVGMGADALSGLTEELENSGGTAAAISQAQMQGLNGSLKELRSAFEGLQIAIAESGLIDFVTDLVKRLADWTRQMAETSPETLRLITAVALFTATVGPVVLIVGKLISTIGALLPVLALLGKAVMLLIGASNPIGLLLIAIGSVIAIWKNWDKIGPIVGAMVRSVTDWLKGRLGAVLDWVGGKVDTVTGFFRDMYNKVVGNSYVPDMVNGIEWQFDRLDMVMVRPAQQAAAATIEAFKSMQGSAVLPVDEVKHGAEKMSEFAVQAARNMQDAFADFLFDPFEDGLKGMLRGFLDTMRRMIAEAASQQIMQALFGGLAGSSNNFLASLGASFGGPRAFGGPVSSGKAFLVGEAGPELFVPGTSGQIIPNHAMGGGTVNNFQTIVQAPRGRITRESEGRLRARDAMLGSQMAGRHA